MVTLQVYFSLIAPWCYIGKRRVDSAVAKLDGLVSVQVQWLPVELNPGLRRGGVNRRAYRTRILGSRERSEELDRLVAELGRDDGIEFHFERIVSLPNTLDAHRLVVLAGREGVQGAVVESLFRAYFTEGRDLSRQEELLNVVTDAGLDRARASQCLEGEELRVQIQSEFANLWLRGVPHVPRFVFNGKESLAWAFGAETLASTLRRADGSGPSFHASDTPRPSRHGFSRTSCDCDYCRVYCRHIPGRLDVGDLPRLCPVGTDAFAWAEIHLQAVTDMPFPKLVPAKRENGHCHWYVDGHCAVHAHAPYGCAFFDSHMTPEQVKERGAAANLASARDDVADGLYSRVWRHLVNKGLTRRSGDPAPLDEEMRRIRLSMEQN